MVDEDLAVEQDDVEGEETAVEDESSEMVGADEPTKEERLMAALKEAISVELKEIGALRLKLTITIPRETIDERMSEEFAELRRDALIPGFRKGHAPLRLVEKRFASDVGDQLKSQLFANGYLAAVEKEGLDPLGDPLFFVKVKEPGANRTDESAEAERLLSLDKALDHLELPREGALTFSCEMELRPKFELPELKGIPVRKPKVAITDEQINAEIERIRMYAADLAPVEEGAIEPNDRLYLAMTMTVDERQVATDDNLELPARDMMYRGMLLSGLGAALVGKKSGDVATLSVTVPDDYTEDVALRGKQATFEFKINEVKRWTPPPLSEELIKNFGYDSEEEMRSEIRTRLEASAFQTADRVMKEQLGNYLVDQTAFEIPQGLSERQTERTLARRRMEMLRGGVSESQVDQLASESRDKAKAQAVRDIKLFFALEKIAQDWEVTVPEEAINGAIHQLAARSGKRFDRVRDELSKGDGLTMLYLGLRDDLILGRLLDDAAVTEAEDSAGASAAGDAT